MTEDQTPRDIEESDLTDRLNMSTQITAILALCSVLCLHLIGKDSHSTSDKVAVCSFALAIPGLSVMAMLLKYFEWSGGTRPVFIRSIVFPMLTAIPGAVVGVAATLWRIHWAVSLVWILMTVAGTATFLWLRAKLPAPW